MMRAAVTEDLLHELVTGSHAEGVTRLASAALFEHGDRVLLILTVDPDDVDDTWELPADLVLPGEPLNDTLHRIAAGVGLHIDRVTGYLGHHDRHVGDDVVRTFVFAAAAGHPAGVCHPVAHRHLWAATDDLPEHLDHDVEPFIHLADLNQPPAEDTYQQLGSALRARARGLYCDEAAVELLLSHPTSWLHRSDFREEFVHTGSGLTGGTPMATVDWPEAITALDHGRLPCSSGEARILKIAASLAEGIPVNLRDALTGLDTTNIHLVATAVLHAGGKK